LQVQADTRGLGPGLYMIYVNVRTQIGGELRAQYVRGFVIIRQGPAAVCTLASP
jgi:hypothetical protein